MLRDNKQANKHLHAQEAMQMQLLASVCLCDRLQRTAMITYKTTSLWFEQANGSRERNQATLVQRFKINRDFL